MEEARQTVIWVNKHFADEKIILTGDFNVTPNSKTIQIMKSSGFVDAWEKCNGAGNGFTFPANVPNRRIDFIFIRGFQPQCKIVVVDTQASDHRPVLAFLEI
jgi:endonuclease/exonuclease/phosphatase (EEP) superfamily protein YafD